jgi:hypothetical protein
MVSMQDKLQSCVDAGQLHWPEPHVAVAGHTVPHMPQFAASV